MIEKGKKAGAKVAERLWKRNRAGASLHSTVRGGWFVQMRFYLPQIYALSACVEKKFETLWLPPFTVAVLLSFFSRRSRFNRPSEFNRRACIQQRPVGVDKETRERAP